MAYSTDSMMRAEHGLWTIEHRNWRKDAEDWKQEVRKAVEELRDVHCMLEDHEAALNAHMDSILQHEKTEAEHEQVLKTSSLLETPVEHSDPMTSLHQGESARHTQQREAHERMKRHQHALMTTWSLMTEALRKAL